MDRDPNTSPFLDVPPAVLGLAVVIFGIELMFSGAQAGYFGGPQAVGWRLEAIRDYAFIGEIFDWMIANSTFPPEYLVRFVTYPFLHAGFTHAIFVVVFILAIGKSISTVFNGWKFLTVFFASSVFGAAVYGAALDSPVPLIGGYPGVYGLIGCFTFLLWVQARVSGAQPLRAFSLIGILLGIQLLFGALFGGGQDWVADLAGFVTGFALSFVLVPGGLARIRAMLKHR
jgi:membrane associated rhomboid family serine protease